MAHKSKALPSSDAPKACSGVTSIIKGCYHSHLHWKMGLQFISEIKKGGDESAIPAEILARDPRARSIYGAVLQSRAGSHKPGKDIFKSNHFLPKCPHKKKKKIAQQIPEHCGRKAQPCAHNIFGNPAHLLFTLSATEATERKITQCTLYGSVLGVLSVI